MRILDLSAGKRNIWFNKLQKDVVFVDIRPEMMPNVVADTKNLPFMDQIFDLVVFDPPHTVNGEKSVMGAYYGVFTGPEIKEIVQKTALEAYRVLKDDGFLAFKWNDHDVRLDHTLPLMSGFEPLFGHNFKKTKRSTTSWMLLRKKVSSYDNPWQMAKGLKFWVTEG